MSNSYTEKQMEAYNLLYNVGKDGVSTETLEEIVNMLGELEQGSTTPTPPKEDSELIIRMKLMEETDWRKKAALSAMLISKSLE